MGRMKSRPRGEVAPPPMVEMDWRLRSLDENERMTYEEKAGQFEAEGKPRAAAEGLAFELVLKGRKR